MQINCLTGGGRGKGHVPPKGVGGVQGQGEAIYIRGSRCPQLLKRKGGGPPQEGKVRNKIYYQENKIKGEKDGKGQREMS